MIARTNAKGIAREKSDSWIVEFLQYLIRERILDLPESIASASAEELARLLSQGKAKLDIQTLKYFEYGWFSYLSKKQLELAEKEVEEDRITYLVPAILLQVTSLECFLNDVIIEFSRESFGKGNRELASSFLQGSIRSKIIRIVPLLSNSLKVLDLNSSCVQNLFEMITTRNKIAHTVEYYTDEFPDFEERSRSGPIAQILQIDHCQRYQQSINNFYSAVWNGPIESPKWQHEIIHNAEPDHD